MACTLQPLDPMEEDVSLVNGTPARIVQGERKAIHRLGENIFGSFVGIPADVTKVVDIFRNNVMNVSRVIGSDDLYLASIVDDFVAFLSGEYEQAMRPLAVKAQIFHVPAKTQLFVIDDNNVNIGSQTLASEGPEVNSSQVHHQSKLTPATHKFDFQLIELNCATLDYTPRLSSVFYPDYIDTNTTQFTSKSVLEKDNIDSNWKWDVPFLFCRQLSEQKSWHTMSCMQCIHDIQLIANNCTSASTSTCKPNAFRADPATASGARSNSVDARTSPPLPKVNDKVNHRKETFLKHVFFNRWPRRSTSVKNGDGNGDSTTVICEMKPKPMAVTHSITPSMSTGTLRTTEKHTLGSCNGHRHTVDTIVPLKMRLRFSVFGGTR